MNCLNCKFAYKRAWDGNLICKKILDESLDSLTDLVEITNDAPFRYEASYLTVKPSFGCVLFKAAE